MVTRAGLKDRQIRQLPRARRPEGPQGSDSKSKILLVLSYVDPLCNYIVFVYLTFIATAVSFLTKAPLSFLLVKY